MTLLQNNLVRRASTADISAIRAIASVAFPATYSGILTPGQLDYMMEWMYSEESLRRQMGGEGHTFFLIDNVGYVSFRYDRRDGDGFEVYHLEKLYVLPEYQKSGLGRLFFELVCNEAVKDSSLRQGASSEAVPAAGVRIELNVNRNNPSVGFYERIGMYRRRQGDFPIGGGYYMNDYIMALDIPA